LAHEGLSNNRIAQELKTTRPTVNPEEFKKRRLGSCA